MNDEFKTSEDGKEVMHHYESCVLRAYPDPASPLGKALQAAKLWFGVLRGNSIPANLQHLSGSPWSIGWGDTGPDVVPGLSITQQDADRRYANRLAREFEPAVRSNVRVPLNQAQFDALVSFAYNAGVDNFRSSTLLRKLNAGDMAGAAAEFPKWHFAQGQSMHGLRRRRAAERARFLGSSAKSAIAVGEATK